MTTYSSEIFQLFQFTQCSFAFSDSFSLNLHPLTQLFPLPLLHAPNPPTQTLLLPLHPLPLFKPHYHHFQCLLSNPQKNSPFATDAKFDGPNDDLWNDPGHDLNHQPEDLHPPERENEEDLGESLGEIPGPLGWILFGCIALGIAVMGARSFRREERRRRLHGEGDEPLRTEVVF